MLLETDTGKDQETK